MRRNGTKGGRDGSLKRRDKRGWMEVLNGREAPSPPRPSRKPLIHRRGEN